MRGEIPDDVDVMLEESEVDSDAIDVVDLAQLAVFDQFLDFANGVIEKISMIHHQNPLAAVRQVDEVWASCTLEASGFSTST